MSHFDEILREEQNMLQHPFTENQQLYDKSTNQSNLMATAHEPIHSPFDSSPKASMFFFSLHSPRQNADNFQFNPLNTPLHKICKDHIQPISRRLEFEEDPSLFCEQQELEEEQATVKDQEHWNDESGETVPKGKRIKKSKNSKGLKNLSIGVYDIVAEKSQTSYKQVANCLIEKLSQRAKEQLNSEIENGTLRKLQKDQHNIKRRVYDALNVLISAELLRKEGKRVICNYNLHQQNSNKVYLEEQRNRLVNQVELKQQILHEKRLQLLRIKAQHSKFSWLFNKNIRIGPRPVESISLPFIAAVSNVNDVQEVSIVDDNAMIQFTKNVLIMGDLDIVEAITN